LAMPVKLPLAVVAFSFFGSTQAGGGGHVKFHPSALFAHFCCQRHSGDPARVSSLSANTHGAPN
jgi:hypothetical protein